jgi:hypothetical protein
MGGLYEKSEVLGRVPGRGGQADAGGATEVLAERDVYSLFLSW